VFLNDILHWGALRFYALLKGALTEKSLRKAALTYPHFSLFWKYGLLGFINTEENFEKESYFTNLLFLLDKCQIDKHFPIISHYSKSLSQRISPNRFLFQRRPEKGEHCLVVLSSKSPFNLVAFYCPQFVSHLCL